METCKNKKSCQDYINALKTGCQFCLKCGVAIEENKTASEEVDSDFFKHGSEDLILEDKELN